MRCGESHGAASAPVCTGRFRHAEARRDAGTCTVHACRAGEGEGSGGKDDRNARVYTYLISFKKCFNPSAVGRKSLKISGYVAEGFDFQIFQQGSAAASQ